MDERTNDEYDTHTHYTTLHYTNPSRFTMSAHLTVARCASSSFVLLEIGMPIGRPSSARYILGLVVLVDLAFSSSSHNHSKGAAIILYVYDYVIKKENQLLSRKQTTNNKQTTQF